MRKNETSIEEFLASKGVKQETNNASEEKAEEITKKKEVDTSEAEKKKNRIKKNQARLKRREALGKTKRGKNSDIVFKDGGFQINQREEKKEQSAIPTKTSKEVKAEAETQTRPEEPSAIEKPEEKTTGNLEWKKERMEELEKKERELLEVFEQNKNKAWEEKKGIITAAINELEKVRAEKAENEKGIADSSTSVQTEDLESDYDIIKKKKPTKEEKEKLAPLLEADTKEHLQNPELLEEEGIKMFAGAVKPQTEEIGKLTNQNEIAEAKGLIEVQKETINKLESRLAAMEAGIKEEENRLIAEGKIKKSTAEKIKDFVKKHPKVTAAIALGIVGGTYSTLGGVPLYFAAKAVLAKAGVSIWAPYMGGISSPGYLAATGGIFGKELKGLAEKIGLIEKEKDVKSTIKDVLNNISGDTEVKTKEQQTLEEKTEKPEGKKESFLSKIFGKRKNRDEEKPEGFLIKRTEKMKKTAPETEDKFGKKAEDVKIFIGQLKKGEKTGKEIFEYLENLWHQFLYTDNPDKTNFNSKIRPELDKLSREEKTDMIDSTVEYFMSQEQYKGEFLRGPFIFDLDDIIYGKDFTRHDYFITGKQKNVEWLYGNELKNSGKL